MSALEVVLSPRPACRDPWIDVGSDAARKSNFAERDRADPARLDTPPFQPRPGTADFYGRSRNEGDSGTYRPSNLPRIETSKPAVTSLLEFVSLV